MHTPETLSAMLAARLSPAPLGLLLRLLETVLPHDARVVASALGGDPVTSFLRRRFATSLLRFTPELDRRVDSWRSQWDDGTGDAVDPQRRLAAADLDVEEHADAADVVEGRRWRRAGRLRRLDTLFGADDEQRGLQLAVVAEAPPRVLEVLEGALHLLASSRRLRPALLLALDTEPAHAEARTRILRLLTEADYVLLDPMLWAREPAQLGTEQIVVSGEWQLAVPRRPWLDGAARRMFGAVGDTADVDVWNRQLGIAWAHETRSGGVRLADYPSAHQVLLQLDGEIPTWGFYPPEGPPGAGWRWIGPRPAAGIVIPGTDRPLRRLRLFAIGASSPRNQRSLVARLDGHSVRLESDWSQGYGAIDVDPGETVRRWRPLHTLELYCAETLRASAQDPRRLALSLSRVQLSGIDG